MIALKPPRCSLLTTKPDFDGHSLPAEHECELGKWYAERMARSGPKPMQLWEGGFTHAQLHSLARDILHSSALEGDSTSLTAMTRFRGLWQKLEQLQEELQLIDHQNGLQTEFQEE